MYTERFEGPLSDEFGDALRQWRFGAMGRDEAIEALGSRLQVEAVARFCASVTQALRLGSPLAKVLREQGAEARTAQRLSIEEQIAKAPVKMLAPMGGLILPAMLVLLLGPIGLRFLTGGF
jgi:tight adherence protein C